MTSNNNQTELKVSASTPNTPNSDELRVVRRILDAVGYLNNKLVKDGYFKEEEKEICAILSRFADLKKKEGAVEELKAHRLHTITRELAEKRIETLEQEIKQIKAMHSLGQDHLFTLEKTSQIAHLADKLHAPGSKTNPRLTMAAVYALSYWMLGRIRSDRVLQRAFRVSHTSFDRKVKELNPIVLPWTIKITKQRKSIRVRLH